jgi:hypothetical protein
MTVAEAKYHIYAIRVGTGLMAGTPAPRIMGQEKLRLEFSKIHSRTKRNKAIVGSLKRTVGNLTLKVSSDFINLHYVTILYHL